MKKTITILRHEFHQAITRKSYILLTISVPLLTIIGYGGYQAVQHLQDASEQEEEKIGYVDQLDMFTQYTSPSDILFTPYANESEARDALLNDEIDEYLIIPEDYIASGRILRFTMKTGLNTSDENRTDMEGFLLTNLLKENAGEYILKRLEIPMILDTYNVDDTGDIAQDSDQISELLLPLVFGLLFTFSIFFSSGFLLQSVSEEKENRVIEILLSSVSSRQLLVGKIFGLGAAGLLQVIIWLITVRLFTTFASINISAFEDMSVNYDTLIFALIYFILGYLLFATIMAGIGSIGSTSREGQSWSGLFTMPAATPLLLNFFIIDNPESTISKVLTIFPLTAPITAMMRIPTDSIQAWELALSLTILLISVLITMWASAKIFHTFILMYGKRPSIKELFKHVMTA